MKAAYLKTKSTFILWDVERMIRDMKSRKLVSTVRAIPIANLIDPRDGVDYDVMGCDVNTFPIVVFLAPDKYRVLTGEEQIIKARQMDCKTISCYTFQPKQHKNYIIDYDEDAYLRAIEEYWEGDLHDEE